MKKAAKVAISVVAVVAFIAVFVGIGENQQAGEQTDYQKTLEETISSKSTSPSQPVPVQPTEENNCDPSYPGVCIPPYPPDLDCGDIPQKNFTVLQPDPHRFDGDKDGIGCES